MNQFEEKKDAENKILHNTLSVVAFAAIGAISSLGTEAVLDYLKNKPEPPKNERPVSIDRSQLPSLSTESISLSHTATDKESSSLTQKNNSDKRKSR